MLALRNFRLTAVFVSLLMALTLIGVGTAEARMGGSFGSRGMRTFQTVPHTQTIPKTTSPIQNSVTPRGTQTSYGAPYANRAGWFGGGLGGWLMGGLLFGGLFGLMAGTGFGGFGGFLGLLVQLAIIYFVVRWLFRRFGQPQMANGARYSYEAPPQRDWGNGSGGYTARPTAPRSSASQRAGRRDQLGITDADLNTFEQRLSQLQDAYAREDETALRRITTLEVFEYLRNELADSRAKGLRNEVYDVKLVRGDVAEAWREQDREYASVALGYESRDVMRDRSTGAIVSGEDRIAEKSEVWTFVRRRGGEWLVSAIQG
jgi:predicted lipid-binding transport protein (Tim44 family)